MTWTWKMLPDLNLTFSMYTRTVNYITTIVWIHSNRVHLIGGGTFLNVPTISMLYTYRYYVHISTNAWGCLEIRSSNFDWIYSAWNSFFACTRENIELDCKLISIWLKNSNSTNLVNWFGFKNKKVLKWQDFYFLTKNKLHKRKDFIVCISFDLFSKNNQDSKHTWT